MPQPFSFFLNIKNNVKKRKKTETVDKRKKMNYERKYKGEVKETERK